MVYVYILQSSNDKGFYIGITKNFVSRLSKHNKGQVESTRKRKPFVLIYNEELKDYKSARLREIEIKSFKGGIKFKELIKHCRVV